MGKGIRGKGKGQNKDTCNKWNNGQFVASGPCPNERAHQWSVCGSPGHRAINCHAAPHQRHRANSMLLLLLRAAQHHTPARTTLMSEVDTVAARRRWRQYSLLCRR